ncbi:MAG: thioesterase family protein [Pseudomonadales bacterium]|nr:thioesterase family protein [Pseudomonadales bacterium]
MSLLQRLIKRLDLQQLETDVYVGGSGEGGVTENSRLFGGMVAAQAAMAAQLTVDDFPLHSLHAYFLRPGRPNAEIVFDVTRAKEGKNFRARNVSAIQNNEIIFQLQASFQREEPGVVHQDTAPALVDPKSLPNRDQLRGRERWREMPIDVRMATEITGSEKLPPDQQIYVRANGDLPADPKIHLAMVVYASDRSLLDTAWRPHADKGKQSGASLDHSMWFHQPPIFNEWLLYDLHSPAARAGRGLAFGAMYNLSGERVVSIAQEGVMRLR